MIGTTEKTEIIKDLAKSTNDTGSVEVQVGILTARIKDLTEHLKTHNKDNHSRRGLLQMVGRRKRLLKYLRSDDLKSYQAVIKKLGLRS